MALAHGSDSNTYLSLAPRDSSSDDPTYTVPPGDHLRIPLAGETMTLVREGAVQSEEITAAGGVQTLELTPGRWRGTFTTLIYYNATWFHYLMCQLFGGIESIRAGFMVNGEAAPGLPATVNTHWYIPQSFKTNTSGSISAITHGIVMRIMKMGADAGASQEGLKVGGAAGGAYIVGCVLDFPAEGWPTATWEVIGPPPTKLGPAAIDVVQPDANDYPVRPIDNSRDNAHPVLPSRATGGVVFVTRNWRRFSLTVRNGLDFPPRFANAWNTEQNIGHVGKFEVTAEWETFLEQGSLLASGLYTEWLAGLGIDNNSRRAMRWISAKSGDTHGPNNPVADQTNNVPYALEIQGGRAGFESLTGAVESAGALTLRWSERWFSRSVASTANAGWPWDDAATSTYKCPVSIAFQVSETDEPVPDGKFSVGGAGGNNPHTTLEG
mgnify:CR=1 FL=1